MKRFIKAPHWEKLPHVRSGSDLTVGERAADQTKRWFGTWTLLGTVITVVVGFMLFAADPGHLLLNLGLSLMAAVQGIILQISANRGDRISSELAIATYKNGQELLKLNLRQIEILEQVSHISERLDRELGTGQEKTRG